MHFKTSRHIFSCFVYTKYNSCKFMQNWSSAKLNQRKSLKTCCLRNQNLADHVIKGKAVLRYIRLLDLKGIFVYLNVCKNRCFCTFL